MKYELVLSPRAKVCLAASEGTLASDGAHEARLGLISRLLGLLEPDPGEPPGRHQLGKETVDNAARADGQAPAVLLPGERHDAHEATSILSDEHLDTEGCESDHDEHPIVEEVFEHVPLLLTELTGVDLVEKLEVDERLEADSVHQDFVGALALDPHIGFNVESSCGAEIDFC